MNKKEDTEIMVNAVSYTTGIPDSEFIQNDKVPGPTKEEIRVISLSKAKLFEGAYVIDVGCGTGGLTVEAALQVKEKGRVFALDQNKEAVDLTEQNAAKFGVQNTVEIICGQALEALPNLPQVDAVFIGGSKSLRETIQLVYKKLKVKGKVVVNSILLETAVNAVDEIRKVGFKDVDVAQIFVVKGKQVPSGTMMLARNPITIISATKK
ncbi:MAG: precorrin-6Y C5,15-methyltransferase (decarboxylating) subunit CbiT [Candidatus Bathyarchaeum tardum]|nr:MAG: precorrin-6Y C5,15-methyltransferase (decarboxylating) subunit CbiT [Candidatus Bathyarchaeum tardum]